MIMLDVFLEQACVKEAAVAARDRNVELMKQLPEALLMKIATGEEKLSYIGRSLGFHEDEKNWLEQFQGTPLFEQAIELQKQELQMQMDQAQRRQQRSEERRAEDEEWRQEDAARDELCIKRKMLEIQLAESQAGGEGGEGGEEAQPFEGKETPEEEALEHGAGSPEAQQAAQAQPPTPPPAAPAAPASPEKAASIDLEQAGLRMREAMQKEALGIGTLGKAIAGAAKRTFGAGQAARAGGAGIGGTLSAAGQAAKAGAGTVGRTAKRYAQSNPLQAAGVAAGTGLGAGYMMGR